MSLGLRICRQRAAEIILDGVVRNRALIVFPASIRRARRIHDFFPQLIDRELQQQFRRRKKQFATALAASARPGEIAG
jgi:hypothetical protein